MHGIVVGKMGYDITKKWKIIECLCVGLLVLVGNVVAESDWFLSAKKENVKVMNVASSPLCTPLTWVTTTGLLSFESLFPLPLNTNNQKKNRVLLTLKLKKTVPNIKLFEAFYSQTTWAIDVNFAV